MIITNRLKYDSLILYMSGETIEYSQEIKIHCLSLDSKLTFNTTSAKRHKYLQPAVQSGEEILGLKSGGSQSHLNRGSGACDHVRY